MSSPSEKPASPPSSPPADAAGPISRRFALGDTLIVIALLAVMCMWCRGTPYAQIAMYAANLPSVMSYAYFEGPLPSLFPTGPLLAAREYVWWTPLDILMRVGLPLIAFGTPTVLLMRLRRPRPAWRELFRQPGFVACLSVLSALLIVVDLSWLGMLIPDWLSLGHAVTASWALLIVSRRWRSEAGWIDRLGRAIGVAWIVWASFVFVDVS